MISQKARRMADTNYDVSSHPFKSYLFMKIVAAYHIILRAMKSGELAEYVAQKKKEEELERAESEGEESTDTTEGDEQDFGKEESPTGENESDEASKSREAPKE